MTTQSLDEAEYSGTMTANLNIGNLPELVVEIAVGGLLFDMDGGLVRSIDGDERCWRRWAARR